MAKQMTVAERKELLDRARALYTEGAEIKAIAQSLHVTPTTVRRWARKADAARTPWKREAPPRPRCSHACTRSQAAAPSPRPAADDLRALLEKRLADLVARSVEEPDKPGAEDRMLKVCKVLEFLRGADDLEAKLRAVKDFAAFCVQTLPEVEMAPVRKAIHMFLDKLKRENS